MDDVLYRVDVDISQVQSKLNLIDKEFKKIEGTGTKSTKNISTKGADDFRKLGFALERFGVRGLAAFGEITAVAGATGIAIGGLLVTLNLVAKALSFVATTAKEAFVTATTASIETGREFDALKAQLTAVFEGAPDAAEAAFSRIRAISTEYGFDATQLARTFIPEVQSLDQLEEIVKLGAALARFQPEQGVTGARIALQGALEGTDEGLRSLQRRFELPKSSIDRIRELQEELGAVDGLIVGLGDELERTGRDLDALGGTLEVQLGRAQEFFRDIRGIAGEPIVDQLIEELGGLNTLLIENKDNISIIANAFGEAVAKIIALLGDLAQSLLESLDEEKALELATAITQIGDSLETLIKLFASGFETSGFDAILSVANKVNEVIASITLAVANLKPAFAFLSDISQQYRENNASQGVAGTLTPGFSDALALATVDFTRAQDAYNDALLDSIGIAAEYALEFSDAANQNRDFADSLGDVGQAGEDAADAILAARQAENEAAQLEADAAEARQKVADETSEYLIDKERARLDLLKKQKRAEIDLEIEIAQKREDIERKNLEDIQDIYRKNAQRIEDARRDLAEDQADIALEYARKQEDLDVESAQKRIKVEEDFRRTLEEIRRKFDFDAQEAIRANDAIAYLRIQRRAEFEIQEAKEKKREETDTVAAEAQRQQEELARLREREVQDAIIANQRQLQELQIRLARELEEQRIAYQRELNEAAIYAQRKREELRRQADRELEDFNETWRRKLEDLQRNLEQELELIRRAEQQKAAIRAQAAARARAASLEAASADRVLLQNYGNRVYVPGRGVTDNPRIDTPTNRLEGSGADTVLTQNYGGGRRFGGPVYPGRRYLVGESGPEMFMPGQLGSIIPLRNTLNSLLFSPGIRGLRQQSSVVNQRTNNIDLSMLDPTTLSPQQLVIMRQQVLQILTDIL